MALVAGQSTIPNGTSELKANIANQEMSAAPSALDIEHAPVRDDPRAWSRFRKSVVLTIVAAASLIAGLGSNIYNPSIQEIEDQLHATSSDISLSLSLFILIQGLGPILWSAVSEVKGRKIVYTVSILLYIIGCVCVATAKNIAVVIAMRCMQAVGSSAVIAIGAATLADIYEPAERGTMMGVYYAAPLLGPSLGPIIGGGLTAGFNWRASFWFLTIFGCINLASFVFLFKDTFRRERSLTYQLVLRRRTREQVTSLDSSKRSSQVTISSPVATEKPHVDVHGNGGPPAKDLENQTDPSVDSPVQEIKLSLTDVNPIPPMTNVLGRGNNICVLVASGLIFAFSYSISYTCARTLASEYGYNAMNIGLVLLSFGIGSMAGSLLGGRWSDRVLRRLVAKNNGVRVAEMRLESTKIAMIFLPISVVVYGWICEEHIHIAAVCVVLFFAGFSSIWIYSSTLAYIVDANTGRSSTAVAANSGFRGLFAFIATEVAVPLQGSIGDGGLYTLWAGLMVVAELLILLVWWKGGAWRERAETREKEK